jgi:protein-tyrosine phosphatase
VRRFIDTALGEGGCVLVHCHEGRSRSVALVAAYLMARRGMDLAGALARIRWGAAGARGWGGVASGLAAL